MSDGLNDSRLLMILENSRAKENHNNDNKNRNKLPRDACDYKCSEPASERKFGAGAGNRCVSNGREETTRINRSSRRFYTTPPSRVGGGVLSSGP